MASRKNGTEPAPRWRRARRYHDCESLGYAGQHPCSTSIEPGAWYLDVAVAQPVHHHVRYCAACAERKGYIQSS